MSIGQILQGAFILLIVLLALTRVLGMKHRSQKSTKARIRSDGEGAIVIKHGQIVDDILRKAGLHADELRIMLKEKYGCSLSDVLYAILEPNGGLYVIPKQGVSPANRQMSSLPAKPAGYVSTEIIVDGKVIQKNLMELGLTRAWLDGELKKAGVDHPSDVFYAEVQSDGSLHVDKRDDLLH